MAAALPAIMVGSAVAGGALSVTGKIMEGRERSAASAFEAQQFDRQNQEYQTASAQAEARRREELTSSLETIQAIRAGRGVGQGSPTGQAILDNIVQDESRDIRTERLNYLTKSEQARMAASMSRRKAKTSLIASYLDAGAEVASTAYRISTARQPRGR